MEQITSRENPRVKRLVRLQNDKSARDEAGIFVAEGFKLCMDAVQSGVVVREMYVTQDALKKHPELARLSCGTFLVSESVAEKAADVKNPQGVFALCEKRPNIERPPLANGRYLLLSSLQDPGSVGAVIRTAEALGLDGVTMSEDCPDLYSPKVLRATMGGAFRQDMRLVPDMRAEIARLRRGGVKIYAAALRENAERIGEIRFEGPCAVLIGNEGQGLPGGLVDACDYTVMIPMKGGADSLSAPIAAAILAWEMTKRNG